MQDEAPSESADGDDSDDYMDETMRSYDTEALSRITTIITDHTSDIELAQSAPGKILDIVLSIEAGKFAVLLDKILNWKY